MGGGGKPGINLGLLTCSKKTVVGQQVTVKFSGKYSSATFVLSAENAEYFVEGQAYDFSATQPG